MGQVHDDKYWLHTWAVTATGATSAVRVSGLADKTAAVEGTFGGTTVTIQGSMDNTNWHAMNFADGTAATFSAAGMGVLLENPRFIRASSAGGTGIDLDVHIGASALK